MQPCTPEETLYQLSERALGSKPKKEDVVAFTRRFCAQPLFVRGLRDPDNPGNVGIAALHSEEDNQSHIFAATTRELSDALPGSDDGEGEGDSSGNDETISDTEILALAGADLLRIATQRNSDLLIITGESDDEDIVIPHASLALLAKIALLIGGEEPHLRPNDAAIRAAYPTAFARWLYDYCRAHPDIREARLALARVGNDPQPDVVVTLRAGAAYTHMDRITAESRRLLQPGQILYTEDRIARLVQGGQLAADLQQHPALYNKNDPQGWWSRLLRTIKPAPLIFIDVELVDDAPQQ